MLSTTLELEGNPFLKTLNTVSRAVDGFKGRIVTFAATFSGLRDAVDLVQSGFNKLSGVIDLGGDLADLSAETGEAAGDLLIFRTALANTRLGGEGMGVVMAKLQKAIAGVNEDGKPTSKVLKELGISAESLVNRPVLEQISALGAAFRGVEDAAKRTKMATDLFGGKGTKFLALLMDEGAIGQARTQVGGLAGTMENLAPTLDAIGDAVGQLSLKFQQLVAGALSVVAPQAVTLADAMNQLDLTGVGVRIGQVAQVVIYIGQVVFAVFPVMISMFAGWAVNWTANWATAAIAARAGSVSIAASIRTVATATMVGARTILTALGPVGLAIAGVTYAWQKWGGSAKMPQLEMPKAFETTQKAAGLTWDESKSPVGRMARIGGAYAGMSSNDPVAGRLDRTNFLLELMNTALSNMPAFIAQARPAIPGPSV